VSVFLSNNSSPEIENVERNGFLKGGIFERSRNVNIAKSYKDADRHFKKDF
jgi:hypothetical protein